MSEASLQVSKMVRDGAWQQICEADSDESYDVALLHSHLVGSSGEQSGLWFAVTRDGAWAAVNYRDGQNPNFKLIFEEERLTVGLVRMLQLSPQVLRERLRGWPLANGINTEADLDELWELVPWRQAVRSGLRWKNNSWTRLAVSWIVQLNVAADFADDLRQSATDNVRSSPTLQEIMLLLADSSD